MGGADPGLSPACILIFSHKNLRSRISCLCNEQVLANVEPQNGGTVPACCYIDIRADSFAGRNQAPAKRTDVALLEPLLDWGTLPAGSALMQRLNSDGSVESNNSLADYGATAAYHVPETDHTVLKRINASLST